MVEAINQGRCTECGEEEDNYRQVSRTYHDQPEDEDEEWEGIERTIVCECGAEATVTISESGVSTTGDITLEDASWNQDSDDE